MAQDVLADGFVRLCIDTSLNFIDDGCGLVVEGQMNTTTGSATVDTLVPVQTTRDVDSLFGEGSILAETLKIMIEAAPSGVSFYAVPRADPAGGVAAQFRTTITGPATSAGRVELFMLDGRYAVDVAVADGAEAIDVANSIVAAVPSNFPYAPVAAAAGVKATITWTAKPGVVGRVGNYFPFKYNWRGLQTYAPQGITIQHGSITWGVGAVTAVDYETILGRCCYSGFALLTESPAAQNALQAYLEDNWDCSKPQCFGHAYTYNQSSLGLVLARSTNAAVFSRLAVSITTPSPAWFLTGHYAASSVYRTCLSPERSVQGRSSGVLDKLLIPESCDDMWTFDEIQELQERGFVIAGPLAGGAGTYTSPYIYNDITNYLYDEKGRPNRTFRDTNARRLAMSTALSVATKMTEFSDLGLFTKNTSIKRGTFGTNPNLMLGAVRSWAKDQIGVLFSEFENINDDIRVKHDFGVAAPCQGNPGKLYVNIKYMPPVRVGEIRVGLAPKLISNCNR